MLDYDFDASVGFHVTLTARALQRALNEELAPLGVTFAQVQVLGWLALEPGPSQAELAQRIGVEPPTLAGTLERMERDGWVRRTPCPVDRRRRRVEVGPAAAPVWAGIREAAHRVRARATRGLSARRLRELQRTLTLLRDNLRQPEEAHRS